jgi:hypothetical protein
MMKFISSTMTLLTLSALCLDPALSTGISPVLRHSAGQNVSAVDSAFGEQALAVGAANFFDRWGDVAKRFIFKRIMQIPGRYPPMALVHDKLPSLLPLNGTLPEVIYRRFFSKSVSLQVYQGPFQQVLLQAVNKYKTSSGDLFLSLNTVLIVPSDSAGDEWRAYVRIDHNKIIIHEDFLRWLTKAADPQDVVDYLAACIGHENFERNQHFAALDQKHQEELHQRALAAYPLSIILETTLLTRRELRLPAINKHQNGAPADLPLSASVVANFDMADNQHEPPSIKADNYRGQPMSKIAGGPNLLAKQAALGEIIRQAGVALPEDTDPGLLLNRLAELQLVNSNTVYDVLRELRVRVVTNAWINVIVGILAGLSLPKVPEISPRWGYFPRRRKHARVLRTQA